MRSGIERRTQGRNWPGVGFEPSVRGGFKRQVFDLATVLWRPNLGTSQLGAKLDPRLEASCFWVYAYPAFLRYAAHSAGGYWARILPQASEIAS